MIKDLKLELGGKERHFTFGILFIGEVLERLDIDYNQLLNKAIKNPFKYAPILMYESLKNTYVSKDNVIDFTEKDLVGWLESEDLLGSDKIIKFIQAFLGTNDNKTPEKVVEEVEEDSVKKK